MLRKLIFLLLKPLCNTDIRIARTLFWLDRRQYLLLRGAKVGKHCRLEKFKYPSEPYLLELGHHVSIGEDVQFITHDGGVWVLRNLEKDNRLDYFGPIRIGNNVFIGNNVILLPNVTIGDNVVIGAGAVVTKDVPSGHVAAGIPAKILCPIRNYQQRKKQLCIQTKGMSFSAKRQSIEKLLKTS